MKRRTFFRSFIGGTSAVLGVGVATAQTTEQSMQAVINGGSHKPADYDQYSMQAVINRRDQEFRETFARNEGFVQSTLAMDIQSPKTEISNAVLKVVQSAR